MCTKSFANDLDTFSKNFKLLPQVQKVELLKGEGLHYYELHNLYLKNIDQKPVITGLLKSLPLSQIQNEGTLSLILKHDLNLSSPEGYILEIKDKQLVIKAEQEAGLFYGCQTLAQLLEDSYDQQIEIPACRITDYPEIAYRAIHLDLKHHLDVGHYYYSMVDRLASIKINAIIIEFEDKLRYRKAPLVGAENAISIEEFAAISSYAKERHIEISPLIQGLGHASFILKHEKYKTLRDDPASDWVFDPLNPATYELQFSLYEDAMEATPGGKYLHVGGDEVGQLGKSTLAKQSGMTPIELQMFWLKKVSEFADTHNRIPIFWDDMLFKLAGLYKTTYTPEMSKDFVEDIWNNNKQLLDQNLPLFPKNCMYMRWSYDFPKIPGNQKAIDWYKANNLNVMAATSAQQIWPMIPRNKSNFQGIKDFCQLTSEKKMSGILCTLWDDCSPHFETLWRGIYDFALFSWNFEDFPVEKSHSLYRHRFYAPALADSVFEFQDLLEEAMPFWEKALLENGDREQYHKKFQLIDLPDSGKTGKWSLKYQEKLNQSKKAISQYKVIKSKIAKAGELTRRNQYSLEVLNQINELQIYSSKLLMLLGQYDIAEIKDKKEAALTTIKYVEGFTKLRKNKEEVYAKTRLRGNPEGYKLDSNYHHHLANGTNNTDWMYVYELAFNKKILDWLTMDWEKLGPGGGGSTFIPTFSYNSPDNFLVRCDMTGSYLSKNGGDSYQQISFANGASSYAFDPNNANTIYVGTNTLNRSIDGGTTWEQVYPKKGDVICQGYNGDHASYNIKTNEQSLYNQKHSRITDIRIDPEQNSSIYFSMGPLFFYSSDSGKSWQTEDLQQQIDFIYTNKISLKDEVFILTSNSLIVFSKTSKTFTRKELPKEMSPAFSFTGGINSTNKKVIFYALHHDSNKTQQNEFSHTEVWSSKDLGETWNRTMNQAITNEANGMTPSYSMISCSEFDAQQAYLVCNQYNEKKKDNTFSFWYGALKTNNAGMNWNWVWKGGGGSGKYGVKDGVGIPNLKDAWVEKAFGGEYIRLLDVGVAPFDGNIAIVTDWYRSMKTIDGGNSWNEIYSKKQPDGTFISRGMDVTTTYGVHFDPFNSDHIAISYTDIGFHHSFNGGKSWIRSTEGVPSEWINTCYWMAFDPDVKGKIWSAWSGMHDFPRGKMTRNPSWKETAKGGVCVSVDGGKSWTLSNKGMGFDSPATSIVLDTKSAPSNRTLYASVYNKGVFKSTDDGKSWKLKNNGIGENSCAFELTLQENGNLFLTVSATPMHKNRKKGRNFYSGAVYKSTDGAESWIKLNVTKGSLFPNGIDYDRQDPNRIYLGCWADIDLSDLVGGDVAKATGGDEAIDMEGGIFLSEDGGNSWISIFDKDQYIYDVTVDPYHDGRVYCCTFNKAAYRSDDYGKTWGKIKGYDFHWGHRIIIDQNDIEKIYITTFGSSVWHGIPEIE